MNGPAMRAGPLQVSLQNSDCSAQMGLEESNGLGPRFLRMGGVMRGAIVAHKAMIGITIQHHLGLLPRGLQRIAELVDLGYRDERILAAEERKHRRLESFDICNRRLRAGVSRRDHPAAVKWRGRLHSLIAARG